MEDLKDLRTFAITGTIITVQKVMSSLFNMIINNKTYI